MQLVKTRPRKTSVERVAEYMWMSNAGLTVSEIVAATALWPLTVENILNYLRQIDLVDRRDINGVSYWRWRREDRR